MFQAITTLFSICTCSTVIVDIDIVNVFEFQLISSALLIISLEYKCQ